jgi:flavin reductase (DIM6/NTAB) family NADH-FMN oxidoreductase RutF
VKDTLRNVRETGEFVVCLATEPLFEQVNATGTDFPAGVSEFAAVGLTAEPSARVAAPRVAESPVALECRLERALVLGDSTVVIGRVVHAAVSTRVVDGDARRGGSPRGRRAPPAGPVGARRVGHDRRGAGDRPDPARGLAGALHAADRTPGAGPPLTAPRLRA